MATNDGQREDKSGKGFAGLSSMVSDVEAAVTEAEHAKPEPSASTSASARAREAQHKPEAGQQPYQQSTQTPSGGSSAGKWMLGIGAVVGFIWLMSDSSTKNTSPAPNHSQSSSPSVNTAPAPSYQPSPVPARPQPPTRPLEEQPSVGTNNVLGPAQIRYCLAEDIRLEAAKGALNNYIGSDVDRFNAMVADYNSRCGQFRYRRGSLESAKSEIEGIRALLQTEGRARFTRAPSVNRDSSSVAKSAPQPDLTTLAVQQRLNAMGYDAGVPDGLPGGKTRTAIVAFQKSRKLPADGLVTKQLLEYLNAENSPARTQSASQPPVALQQPATQPPPPVQSPTRPLIVPQESSEKPDLSKISPDESQAIERTCDSTRRYGSTKDYYGCLARELNKLGSVRGRPDLSRANAEEQQSIERTCDSARRYNGPADYYGCLTRELNKLGAFRGKPDLSRANTEEQLSIERACDSARRYNGPADYYACLTRELNKLISVGAKPDVSRASSEEQLAIDRACDSARRYNGPGDYYGCLARELNKLSGYRGRPDMSRASSDEQQAIERACDSARRYNGPGDYYGCLSRELGKLGSFRGRPDISRASVDEQQAIERACDSARRYNGPGDYYACLTREFSKLGYR